MDEETDKQIDVAGLTMAHAFGAAAPPPGLSTVAIAAIEMQANFAQRLPGADRFLTTARSGPVGQKSAAEREEEEAKDALEFLSLIAEEQKRERDEWARSSHAFAGIELTGEQWGELGDELRRDGPLRQWLISRMVRDGKTDAQAAAKADEFADVFTALSKPPSQRSPEENAAIDRARSDPDFQRYTSQIAGQHFGGRTAEVSVRSGRTDSVERGQDAFATAPPLGAHHRASLVATTPLDVPKPVATVSNAAMPAAPAGLEV